MFELDRNRKIFLCFIVVLVLAGIIQITRIDQGVFFDEGSHLFKTSRILEGAQLYVDVGENRVPGLYVILLSIAAIIQEPLGVLMASRFVNILFYLGCGVLVFAIGNRISSPLAGLIASILFLFNPLTNNWAIIVVTEFPTIFFLLVGMYFLINALNSQSLLFSFVTGLFLSLAVVMRQTAALVLLVVFLLFSYRKLKIREIISPIFFFIGSAIPLLVLFGFFYFSGSFDVFFSNILFTQVGWDSVGFEEKIEYLYILLYSGWGLILLLPGLGEIITQLCTKKSTFLIFLILIISLFFSINILITTNYPKNYLVVTPLLAILSGKFIFETGKMLFRNSNVCGKKIFAITLIFSFCFVAFWSVFDSTVMIHREDTSLENQLMVANFLKENTTEDDLVLSLTPTLPFLSGINSVTHLSYPPGLPTASEFLYSLQNERLKYVIFDPRLYAHFSSRPEYLFNYTEPNIKLEVEFKFITQANGTGNGLRIWLNDLSKTGFWYTYVFHSEQGDQDTDLYKYQNILVESADEWNHFTLNVTDDYQNGFDVYPERIRFGFSVKSLGGNVSVLIRRLGLLIDDERYDLYTNDDVKTSFTTRFAQKMWHGTVANYSFVDSLDSEEKGLLLSSENGHIGFETIWDIPPKSLADYIVSVGVAVKEFDIQYGHIPYPPSIIIYQMH